MSSKYRPVQYVYVRACGHGRQGEGGFTVWFSSIIWVGCLPILPAWSVLPGLPGLLSPGHAQAAHPWAYGVVVWVVQANVPFWRKHAPKSGAQSETFGSRLDTLIGCVRLSCFVTRVTNPIPPPDSLELPPPAPPVQPRQPCTSELAPYGSISLPFGVLPTDEPNESIGPTRQHWGCTPKHAHE